MWKVFCIAFFCVCFAKKNRLYSRRTIYKKQIKRGKQMSMDMEDKVFMQAMSFKNIIEDNGLLPVVKNRKDIKANEYFEEDMNLVGTEFVMTYRVMIPNSRVAFVVTNEIADLLNNDILPMLNQQDDKIKLQIWALMGFDLNEMFKDEDVSVKEMIKETTDLNFTINGIARQNQSYIADYTIVEYGGEIQCLSISNDVFDNAGMFALDIAGVRHIAKVMGCSDLLIGFADNNELIAMPLRQKSLLNDVRKLEDVLQHYENRLSDEVYTIGKTRPLLTKIKDLPMYQNIQNDNQEKICEIIPFRKSVSEQEQQAMAELEALIEEELGFDK